ncbi:oxidoreductase, partial [Pseudomonas syringae pv. actinidiae]|nr:oxidoreductase [Pseudomonas syringae pv. actinidiae]NVL45716.1 oxidoreductase [Pseudomonas syringae pv. actinidiae]
MFKGILIDKSEAGHSVKLTDIDQAQLPPGDVTVSVSHSTLNYKDALAITGQSPIVRSFPMVPGIDLAGMVEASDTPEFKVG